MEYKVVKQKMNDACYYNIIQWEVTTLALNKKIVQYS